MIFVFESEAAAKKWGPNCFLASGMGRKMRIRKTRDSDELELMLRFTKGTLRDQKEIAGGGDTVEGLGIMEPRPGLIGMGGRTVQRFRGKDEWRKRKYSDSDDEREDVDVSEFRRGRDEYKTRGSGNSEDCDDYQTNTARENPRK